MVDILEIMGLRVIEAPDLPHPAILIPSDAIVLIDSTLSPEGRTSATDQVIAEAIDWLADQYHSHP